MMIVSYSATQGIKDLDQTGRVKKICCRRGGGPTGQHEQPRNKGRRDRQIQLRIELWAAQYRAQAQFVLQTEDFVDARISQITINEQNALLQHLSHGDAEITRDRGFAFHGICAAENNGSRTAAMLVGEENGREQRAEGFRSEARLSRPCNQFDGILVSSNSPKDDCGSWSQVIAPFPALTRRPPAVLPLSSGQPFGISPSTRSPVLLCTSPASRIVLFPQSENSTNKLPASRPPAHPSPAFTIALGE